MKRCLSRVPVKLDHRAVMRAFGQCPKGSARQAMAILFRQETDFTLVQSASIPDWTSVLSPAAGVAVKQFEIPVFEKGTSLQFCLVLNPVKRERISRKLKPVRASTWLEKRQAAIGAIFTPSQFSARTERDYSSTSSTPVLTRQVRVQGTLEVTAPAAFEKAMLYGVGRGRAYGCGLLSVAPISINY